MNNKNQAIIMKSPDDLKIFLAKNYMAQIKNFFGDEKQSMRFLSSVMASVQKLPALLDCESLSVVNSFMTMAQLGLMPSDVSGEAYVLPYKGKAQFQLGYQGLITLFYRAGCENIRAEIVREHDVFSYKNGIINHEIDIFKSNDERGKPIGAYTVAMFRGQEIAKVMNKKDIMEMGKNFSKSFATDFTPWKEKNDPELWMWKKTVLKQMGKLLPKNATIYQAIAADNEDSRINTNASGLVDSHNLKMGNLLKDNNNQNENSKKEDNKKKEEDGTEKIDMSASEIK